MYKTVIGLEVHCELETKSKNFSTAANSFTDKPNENVMPVDLGLPGILPTVNKEAVRKALKTAIALNTTSPEELIFDRKNYFYPDLPKGYQITQVTKPIGINGYLDIKVNEREKRVKIHQIHLEEDTASLEHLKNFSLLDYNRSGIPLIEIVTEPCLSSADEAISFLETLRKLFLYCEVSQADTKKGQMRCDVNISLMKKDATKLGTKVEMKNINSFSTVRDSIEYEIKRQAELLNKGEEVIQETRRYSIEDNKTYGMREKVDAVDYKYYVEPNLPPFKLTNDYIEQLKKEVPILAFEREKKYIDVYKLSEYDASVITADREVADYFEEVISFSVDYNQAANWVTTVVIGTLNKLNMKLSEFFIIPEMLAKVIELVSKDKISRGNAKKIIYRSIKDKVDPIEIIEKENIKQIDNKDLLLKFVIEAIEEKPQIVKEYIAGNINVANFFIGAVMNKTNRQANPKIVLELIKEELERRKKDEV